MSALKPHVPPDLTCSHLPLCQQVFTPSLDCKEHPIGDSVASPMTEGSKDSWGPAHHTITSAPRRGQSQGHEQRFSLSYAGRFVSHPGWCMGLLVHVSRKWELLLWCPSLMEQTEVWYCAACSGKELRGN